MTMPDNWQDWFNVIAGLCTITSLILFFMERHRRITEDALILGFLRGIRSQVQSMGNAGDEWRVDVANKSPEQASQYANTSVNGWLRLTDQVEETISRIEALHKKHALLAPLSVIRNRIAHKRK